jgi:hypothetical protein
MISISSDCSQFQALKQGQMTLNERGISTERVDVDDLLAELEGAPTEGINRQDQEVHRLEVKQGSPAQTIQPAVIVDGMSHVPWELARNNALLVRNAEKTGNKREYKRIEEGTPQERHGLPAFPRGHMPQSRTNHQRRSED